MNIEKIKSLLQKINNISRRERTSIYLVGGLVRDLLLQRKLQFGNRIDIDFTLDKNVKEFVEGVATEFDSKIVILDERFATFRIVLKEGEGKYYQIDFSSFKGENIKQDLKNRDFTINAFAMKLSKFLNLKNLTDLHKNVIFPPGAKKDLEEKRIIPVSFSAFEEDPLRLVRAFSMGAILDFNIPEKIIKDIEKQRKLIKDVSSERIRDEVFRLFTAEDSYKYIKLMGKCKLLDEIFPELEECRDIEQGPYHSMDIYWHSIECIGKYEEFSLQILKDEYLKPRLEKYLNEDVAGNRKREGLFKLALLLHDIGKPKAKEIDNGKIKFWGHENISKEKVEDVVEKLKLSKVERRNLKDIVYYHMRPGNLAEEENPTDKAVYRFFRHAGENTPAVILLSVADKYATAGELVSEASMVKHKEFLVRLLKRYYRIQEEVRPKKLVDGNDVMKILKLEPSPKIGQILEEVELLQMQGKLKNRKEALQYIKELK